MQKIAPFLWFDGNAEEAVHFYVSVFRRAGIGAVTRYSKAGAQVSGRPEGSIMTLAFHIEGQEFIALNGGPQFRFSEAVSFVVHCDSQEEIDYYWDRLSAGGDPAAQRCGWLKDRYGVPWQVVPRMLAGLMLDPARAGAVMEAVLQMRRIDLEALRRAARRTGGAA